MQLTTLGCMVGWGCPETCIHPSEGCETGKQYWRLLACSESSLILSPPTSIEMKQPRLCLYAGAREVVMLDREAIALQCSLLSAQACGLDSVEDHNLHPSPLANAGEQGQQAAGQSQLQGSHGSTAADRGSAAPSSSHNSAAQPQVSTLAEHFGSPVQCLWVNSRDSKLPASATMQQACCHSTTANPLALHWIDQVL